MEAPTGISSSTAMAEADANETNEVARRYVSFMLKFGVAREQIDLACHKSQELAVLFMCFQLPGRPFFVPFHRRKGNSSVLEPHLTGLGPNLGMPKTCRDAWFSLDCVRVEISVEAFPSFPARLGVCERNPGDRSS